MLSKSSARSSLALAAALLWTPASCFAPANGARTALSFGWTTTTPSPSSSSRRGRTGTVAPRAPLSFLQAERSARSDRDSRKRIDLEKKARRRRRRRRDHEHKETMEPRETARRRHRRFVIPVIALLLAATSLPSPSLAASNISHVLSRIPSPSDLKSSLVTILDRLAESGPKGMITYVLSFVLWTMTAGVTTPVETAAGMAFPLKTAVPLSAAGKIGGALCQYVLAKYLFSEYARRRMKDNEWMDKIDESFKSHPYRVALIWRFSPLPEFVKNVGPALVPSLRTRTQALAILTHGLPFTVLWSAVGGQAAEVARGGGASLALKRTVALVTWVGLVVSPTLFGWWIRGLGGEEEWITEEGED